MLPASVRESMGLSVTWTRRVASLGSGIQVSSVTTQRVARSCRSRFRV